MDALWQCCRNAWANYYQYMGQSIFLQHLQKMGSSAHVIFMDMDVLILDDIMEVSSCLSCSIPLLGSCTLLVPKIVFWLQHKLSICISFAWQASPLLSNTFAIHIKPCTKAFCDHAS